jgi:toxin ParE1/3/4
VKPARLRAQAKADLSDVSFHYALEGGERLGRACLNLALDALDLLATQPAMGSLRWAQPAEQPPLRAWRVKRFPVLWFYFEREDHLDVVRLLGERQDIAAMLAGTQD